MGLVGKFKIGKSKSIKRNMIELVIEHVWPMCILIASDIHDLLVLRRLTF